MRALLRNMGNVSQIFLEAVTVENVTARTFQIDAAGLAGFGFIALKLWLDRSEKSLREQEIPAAKRATT
jgi:hypothetical protein